MKNITSHNGGNKVRFKYYIQKAMSNPCHGDFKHFNTEACVKISAEQRC